MGVPEEPIDPDVDLPTQRRELTAHPAVVLATIAAGGVLGAEARAGIAHLMPTPAGGFPVSTLLINATGCVLIGVLMVLVLEAKRGHPLTRPFLGVGVLGGYTTFSGYAVDAQRLLAGGHVATAVTALALTPVLALLAVTVAARVTRKALL
ncbi:MAG TPA: CrcB family protein [Mycobacteriales bacterium]|nr:CrcB family protein [Mycobacteriales bacterium]